MGTQLKDDESYPVEVEETAKPDDLEGRIARLEVMTEAAYASVKILVGSMRAMKLLVGSMRAMKRRLQEIEERGGTASQHAMNFEPKLTELEKKIEALGSQVTTLVGIGSRVATLEKKA